MAFLVLVSIANRLVLVRSDTGGAPPQHSDHKASAMPFGNSVHFFFRVKTTSDHIPVHQEHLVCVSEKEKKKKSSLFPVFVSTFFVFTTSFK